MPTFRDVNGYPVHIAISDDYQPGDMPPSGYIARQEWAAAQIKAGLKAESCGHCGRWNFPQEMNPKAYSYQAFTRTGEEITVEYQKCLECEPIADHPAESERKGAGTNQSI